LNGLRGWGAFAVFLFHFQEAFWKMDAHPKDQDPDHPLDGSWNTPTWVWWARNSPLGIIMSGYGAVSVFFVLSGFVLPLSWFKSRSYSSIYGGLFRRYLRLMLPMLLCLSFYYIAAKMDFTTRKGTFGKVKPKTFLEFLEDGTIGVWFMNTDYAGLTWTLSVELFASYFIYVIALVPIHYNGRFWVYGLTLFFAYLPRFTDAYNFTQYGFDSMYAARPSYLYDKAIRMHLPTFAWGVIFADIECININGRRPLDVIRKLSIWVKIPLNLFLFTLFITFGTVDIEPLNNIRDPENQKYSLIISFGYIIGMPICMLIAALSIFFLCLTSRVAYIILDSRPFQFMGEISYCLYLMHTLIIEWPMKELQYYWVQQGIDYDYAAYYTFLIFCPVLIIIAWLCTLAIDTPAKNLVMDIDINCREQPPKPRKGKAPIKQVGCGEFFITRWQVWTIAIYLLTIFIITETYQSLDGNRERITADGGGHRPPGMQAT